MHVPLSMHMKIIKKILSQYVFITTYIIAALKQQEDECAK